MHYFCAMDINSHTHRPSNKPGTIEIVNWRYGRERKPENARYISVGVHPWDADMPTDWESLRLEASEVIAVGECGLDKACGVPMDVQAETFRKQVSIAEETGRPMIVHCVRAYGLLSEIRKSMRCRQPWIVHGCYASAEWISSASREDVYCAIGPVQLGMKRGAEVARAIPLERLLAETDDSEEGISAVIEKISEIRGEDVSAAVEQNALRALKIRL